MSLNCSVNRLDSYLVANNFANSRQSAKALITQGYVKVNQIQITKPSFSVGPEDTITVETNSLTKYVSRGAFKLEAAIEHFKIDVSGMTAVDFGASTGGFTDCLLQNGAETVYAIENGVGQLHEKLLNDNRVKSFDNTNARYLEKGFIPFCDIAVMDVSFISQTKLYNSVTNVLKKDGIFISLIKPQFEAGKSNVGKKGIIKNPEIHQMVIENIKHEAELHGFETVDIIPSPILGGDGNKEFLAYFRYKG